MNTNMTITKSFNTTIIDSDLSSLPDELLEYSIDAILEEGVLEALPIVRTIKGAIKTAGNIQDKLFLNKIVSFLFHLKDVDSNQRKKMISNIDSNQKFKVQVGEKLLYIIDKCDDHSKSAIVSLIFKAYIEEKIKYSDFLRTVYTINNISYEDLQSFVQIPDSYDLNSIDCYYYIQAGLVKRLTIEEVKNIEGIPQGGFNLGVMHNRYTHEGEIIRQTLKDVFNEQLKSNVFKEKVSCLEF